MRISALYTIIKIQLGEILAGKTLFALTAVALLLGNVALLFCTNFGIRFFCTSTANTFTVLLGEMSFAEAKDAVQKIDSDNYYEITINLDGGICVAKKLSGFELSRGRRPTAVLEAIGDGVSYKLGDEIELFGKTFSVVGEATFYNIELIISEGDVPDDFKISAVILQAYMTKHKAINRELTAVFGEYVIVAPKADAWQGLIRSPILSVLIVISTIAMLLSYLCVYYLVFRMREALAVFKLCGAKNSRLISGMALLWAGLLCAVFVISGLLYLLIKRTILMPAQDYRIIYLLNYNLSIGNYLAVDIAYFVLILPLIVIGVLRVFGKRVDTRNYD